MKKLNIFAAKGVTAEESKKILKMYEKGIEMYVDSKGRVYTESGIHIADAVEVLPGEGIGC